MAGRRYPRAAKTFHSEYGKNGWGKRLAEDVSAGNQSCGSGDPPWHQRYGSRRKAGCYGKDEGSAVPSPASVAGIATSEERQSAEKLLAALSSRFLSGETIPEDLRARFQQAAGDKIPFTDAAVRKMILAIVQSPLSSHMKGSS